jgi:hypothetical protein
MNARPKLVLALAAGLLLAADAQAGRWLSRDPLQEGAGFVARDAIQREPNPYVFVLNDSVNKIDPFGLWTTAGHRLIADDWLKDRYDHVKFVGFEIDVKQAFKNASARTDGFFGAKGFQWVPNLNPFSSRSFWRQQSVRNAHQHMMHEPGESPEVAVSRALEFVDRMIASAVSRLQCAPDARERRRAIELALGDLGAAFHTLTDAYSPMHNWGQEQWDGLGHALTHPVDTIRDHPRGESDRVWNNWPQAKKDEVLQMLNLKLREPLDRILNGSQQ